MKRLLITLLTIASASFAQAQWTKPSVQPKTDMILDEPSYLYNVGTQMFLTQGNAYGTQASVAEEGLLVRVDRFLVEKTTEAGDTIYDWDDKTYTIQDFRPVQQKWYYMFIDNLGGCYVDKADQEDYFWELSKQESGYWRISCAAKNPVQNPSKFPESCAGVERWDNDLTISTVVNPVIDLANLSTEATYSLEWAFVSEADYAVYTEQLTTYNTALELKALIDDLQGRNIDTAALTVVYDNTSSTLDELLAAIKQAEALISQDDEKNVTVENPIDLTNRIQNPDFTQDVKGENGGWNKEGTAKTFEINGWVPATVEDVMTSPALNLWGSNQDIYVWQDVEGIPNGIYEFTAGVYSQANGPYIHAGGSKTAVTTGGPSPYRVLAYVTDHVIRIGVGFPAEGTQWVMADCFRLKYFGNSLKAYKMWIDETLSSDESLEEKACYSPLKEAYTQSLEKLKVATGADELMAELPHFTELYDSIKTCTAAYDEFKELLAKGVQMIIDDAYAGEDFYVLADYVDFDIEPNEIFPNGNAAYILQNGTLTTEQIKQEQAFMYQLIQNVLDNCMGRGADATAKLSNANFDAGLSGWLFDKKLGTPSPGGMSANPNVERWNQNFDFYQEVELPNGVYQLSAQAFYRTAANSVAEQEWQNSEAQVLTSLYANTAETLIKNVYAEAQEEGFYKEDNAYTLSDGRVVPNSMKTASEAFSAGLYQNTVKGVVWNGRLRLGVRSLNASATDRWSIWDNFRLTYLGMEAEPIAECYDKTVAEANEMLSNPEISDEQKAGLIESTAAVVDKTDASATLETIANIRKAMDTVNAVISGLSNPTASGSSASTPSCSVYSLHGAKQARLRKGLNIVRMSDGRIRKVMVR